MLFSCGFLHNYIHCEYTSLLQTKATIVELLIHNAMGPVLEASPNEGEGETHNIICKYNLHVSSINKGSVIRA